MIMKHTVGAKYFQEEQMGEGASDELDELIETSPDILSTPDARYTWLYYTTNGSFWINEKDLFLIVVFEIDKNLEKLN